MAGITPRVKMYLYSLYEMHTNCTVNFILFSPGRTHIQQFLISK